MDEREVVACPYCAEEILRAAKKCKHCGEFLTHANAGEPQPNQPTPRATVNPARRKHPVQRLFTWLGTAFVAGGGVYAYNLYQQPVTLVVAAAGVVLFLLLAGLIWRISDAFRRFATPDVLYVRDASWSGIASAKLWMLFGPQFLAMGLFAFLLAAAPVTLAERFAAPTTAEALGVAEIGPTRPDSAKDEVIQVPAEAENVPQSDVQDGTDPRTSSEYDLVGSSPVADCDSVDVRRRVESVVQQSTNTPPGRTESGRWWEVVDINTLGPAPNGNRCSAVVTMANGDVSRQMPIQYTTRYVDSALTVEFEE